MFTNSATSRRLAVAVLICVVILIGGHAVQAQSKPTAVDDSGYRYVPVSFWLIPHLGTNGLADDRMETNLALSLGASGYARLRGLDMGLAGSWITEQMIGAQLTVGINYVRERASGAQLTVGANYVGQSASGAQLAVGANIAPRHLTGLQASSGYNQAGSLRGTQLGLVNYGGEVTGSQIGLINIGRKVRGAQIGLLNLSEEVDAPVGLISLVKNGQQHLEIWGSDSALFNVGLKLGSRYVYSLLTAGYQPHGEIRRWMLGLGLGGHIPVTSRFYINTDTVFWQINEDEAWTDEVNMLNKLRVIGGYRLDNHFAVFAGVTFNTLVTRVNDGSDFGLLTGRRLTSDSDETAVRVWPGFLVGLRI